MTNNTINKILDYKLKVLKASPEDTTYVEKMLREMGISDPMEASIMRVLLKTSMLKGKMNYGTTIQKNSTLVIKFKK